MNRWNRTMNFRGWVDKHIKDVICIYIFDSRNEILNNAKEFNPNIYISWKMIAEKLNMTQRKDVEWLASLGKKYSIDLNSHRREKE